MKAPSARIVLTGATGGIGQAAAETLLRAGASLMLVGRSPARLATEARDLAHCGHDAAARLCWHAADLTDPLAIDALAQAAAAWRCNVLVHGAGVPSFGPLESLASPEMSRVLATNLLAPMLLTQALLPYLRGLPRAQVVFVGSVLGRLGLPGYSVYSASKFGLRGFAEALRRELGGTGISLHYLGPRSTRTGFNSEAVDAYNLATATAVDPPAKVAQALLQLLEGEAAERFIGFPEALAVRLNGLQPTLLDGAFAKHRASMAAPRSADPQVAARIHDSFNAPR